MTPEPSLCGTTRAKGIGRMPARDFTSDGLTPLHAMRTRTSPAAGCGGGSLPSVSTWAAGPVRS
jgi:hypothetical protein